MYLPPARASTNAVIYKMRLLLLWHFLADESPTRRPPPIVLWRQAFCSPALRATLARRFRGTGGIDTPLSTHGYFTPPVKTDGGRSVARNVPAFRRTGRPSTNRPAT